MALSLDLQATYMRGTTKVIAADPIRGRFRSNTAVFRTSGTRLGDAISTVISELEKLLGI
jgi:hypothetical protein